MSRELTVEAVAPDGAPLLCSEQMQSEANRRCSAVRTLAALQLCSSGSSEPGSGRISSTLLEARRSESQSRVDVDPRHGRKAANAHLCFPRSVDADAWQESAMQDSSDSDGTRTRCLGQL